MFDFFVNFIFTLNSHLLLTENLFAVSFFQKINYLLTYLLSYNLLLSLMFTNAVV